MSEAGRAGLSTIAACLVAVVVTLSARGALGGAQPAPSQGQGPAPSAYETLVGCRFGAIWQTPAAPLVMPILPDFPGAYAIWGSLGRDSSGHIWFGVTSADAPTNSAHLFEYAPETGLLSDRGDVVSQLRRAGVYRDGETQAKIHSRIVQAADGFLYFASMDEVGERDDGSQLPTWGGHLWRVRPGSTVWEHLLATPEALIAVSGAGTRIYALGYFDHVLYQFDTTTRRTRSVHVGSRGGHVSRNFVADDRGHVYVPRLAPNPKDPPSLQTTLVEFDESLREIASTPIDHYSQMLNEKSHGLVGVQYLADHSIAITTDQGFLYRIVPRPNAAAEVRALGWFHPLGEAYVATLLTDDGSRHLMGASLRNKRHEWLTYDLVSHTSVAEPLEFPPIDRAPADGFELYGSMAMDNAGRGYIAGNFFRDRRRHPVVFQVREAAAR